MARKKVTKDIKLVFFLDQTTPNCSLPDNIRPKL